MIGMPRATAAPEGHHHALGRRCGEDFAAMHGQQALLAVTTFCPRQWFQHQRLGDAVAADQPDDDVDARVGDDREGVVGEP